MLRQSATFGLRQSAISRDFAERLYVVGAAVARLSAEPAALTPALALEFAKRCDSEV